MDHIDALDDASTNTSIDDKTEDFDDNPTRDTLTDGMLGLLRPAIEQLDDRVKATRIGQAELKQNLDAFADVLKTFSAHSMDLELEKSVRKLDDAKARIVVMSNVLQSTQDRLLRLTQHINKEQSRRKALVEPSQSTGIIPSSDSLEPPPSCN